MIVCYQTWVPIRKEPHSASEMVSCLIFGERAEVLQEQGDWFYISCLHDGYKGWVGKPYISLQPGVSFSRVLTDQGASWVHGDERIHLSAGSLLPETDEVDFMGKKWNLVTRRASDVSSWWQTARGFLHVPYLWGGRSDCGMDCSGLVQVVARIQGHSLPRDSKDQAILGTQIHFGDHRPDDLAFFQNDEGRVTHVGILSENGIIHAHGMVREDRFSNDGIINRESLQVSHRLYSIRRL